MKFSLVVLVVLMAVVAAIPAVEVEKRGRKNKNKNKNKVKLGSSNKNNSKNSAGRKSDDCQKGMLYMYVGKSTRKIDILFFLPLLPIWVKSLQFCNIIIII